MTVGLLGPKNIIASVALQNTLGYSYHPGKYRQGQEEWWFSVLIIAFFQLSGPFGNTWPFASYVWLKGFFPYIKWLVRMIQVSQRVQFQVYNFFLSCFYNFLAYFHANFTRRTELKSVAKVNKWYLCFLVYQLLEMSSKRIETSRSLGKFETSYNFHTDKNLERSMRPFKLYCVFGVKNRTWNMNQWGLWVNKRTR